MKYFRGVVDLLFVLSILTILTIWGGGILFALFITGLELITDTSLGSQYTSVALFWLGVSLITLPILLISGVIRAILEE